MPLLELDADTAWSNVYSPRGISVWPGQADRIEPISHPQFDASFKIPAGSKIFTAGSCFARNIEQHLATYQFDVPSHRYFGDLHVINKYNPFSMLQEIRWGLGIDKPLTLEQRLIQVGDRGWIDMHVHHNMPAPKEEYQNWMRLSDLLYSEVRGCPYFIITLGLIEVWYDLEVGVYLNEPLNYERMYKEDEGLRRHFAKRFRFQVLSFDEAYRATYEMFALIKEHASSDCKAILTVSPVPLNATFTGKDVLTANMYSKSMLRTVAEEICHRFDFIDYFPSYESIVLSPRREVYENDGQHVKDHAVSFNVKRMVDAYLDSTTAPGA
jgi:hypothetical protein